MVYVYHYCFQWAEGPGLVAFADGLYSTATPIVNETEHTRLREIAMKKLQSEGYTPGNVVLSSLSLLHEFDEQQVSYTDDELKSKNG